MTRRGPLDLSLYLVTDTGLCGAAGVARTVRDAVRGGVSLVQLRDPSASDRELVELGRSVRSALDGSGVPPIVNDRVDLVDEIGAAGAHIGQSDLPVQEARALLGYGAHLGLSVQSHDHLDALADLDRDVLDYLGVGPVWPQATKPDAASPIGLDAFRSLCAASRWPCVGIGGVGAVRVGVLRSLGAAGAAVVSAICGSADPEAAARLLRTEWDSAA